MTQPIEFSDKILPGPAMRRLKMHPHKVFIRSRFDRTGRKTPDQIHDFTFQETYEVIKDFAKGLARLGFKPKDRLAVFGPNRPRWIFTCFAAIYSGGVHVPIYPSSKEEDVWWILFDSGAKFVVCGGLEHAKKVLAVKSRVPTLEGIILMDAPPEGHDPFIRGFDEVAAKGRKEGKSDAEFEQAITQIQEDDLAAVIYTSGTTGRPKGVMLTHKNFIAQRELEADLGYSEDEIILAHLPMCHSFGFSADLLNAGNIGATMFVSDSLETNEMRKNLTDIRPTIMASVPRLWEKFYINIGKAIKEQPPFKQKMVGWAIGVGQRAFNLKKDNKPLPALLALQARLADRVLGKLKEKVGMERLKFSATGGGPIDPKLIDFFGGLGINLYQGFGLTETAPIVIACTPKANKVGCVGKPLSNVEVKIAEDGELLIRAPQVMKGYLNNPDATAESIDKDGWFYTGDIGEIDSEGYVRITDRKKELLITSGGKNIAPQPIENEFNTDPYIELACCIGDNRNFVSALVVPEFDNVREWLKEKTGEVIEDRAKLVDHPKVKELIEERVQIVNQRLAKYEQIKKYCVLTQPFSEEGGELTPSLKKKRRVINEKYKDKIRSMYPGD